VPETGGHARPQSGSHTKITVILPSIHSRRMISILPMKVMTFIRSRTIAAS
jgi:hypothetical protein